MNRRTFISGSIATMALAPAFGRLAAQDSSNLEPRWDEASQLYGNAWHLLTTAEDGTIQLLNLTAGNANLFGTQLLGVIHNATDEPKVFTNAKSDDPDVYPIPTTMHGIIQPGGYAIAAIQLLIELAPGDDIPQLEPEFTSPEDIEDDFGFYAETIPVNVDAASFSVEHSTATITNTGDTAIEESLFGMVMFFDELGAPTMEVSRTELGPAFEPLSAGESIEIRYTNFTEIDPTRPYLLGYYYYVSTE